MADEVAGVEFGGITPNEEKSTESSQRNLQMLNNLSVDINVVWFNNNDDKRTLELVSRYSSRTRPAGRRAL